MPIYHKVVRCNDWVIINDIRSYSLCLKWWIKICWRCTFLQCQKDWIPVIHAVVGSSPSIISYCAYFKNNIHRPYTCNCGFTLLPQWCIRITVCWSRRGGGGRVNNNTGVCVLSCFSGSGSVHGLTGCGCNLDGVSHHRGLMYLP